MIGALRPTTSGWLVCTTIGRRIGAGFHPQHGKEFMFSSILAGNWVWRQGDKGWVQRHGREFKFDSGSLLRLPQSVLGGNLSFSSRWQIYVLLSKFLLSPSYFFFPPSDCDKELAIFLPSFARSSRSLGNSRMVSNLYKQLSCLEIDDIQLICFSQLFADSLQKFLPNTCYTESICQSVSWDLF